MNKNSFSNYKVIAIMFLKAIFEDMHSSVEYKDDVDVT